MSKKKNHFKSSTNFKHSFKIWAVKKYINKDEIKITMQLLLLPKLWLNNNNIKFHSYTAESFVLSNLRETRLCTPVGKLRNLKFTSQHASNKPGNWNFVHGFSQQGALFPSEQEKNELKQLLPQQQKTLM